MSTSHTRRVTLGGLCTVAGTAACAATLFGFLGRLWWVWDLCAHFRVQYLLALAVVLVVTLVRRRFVVGGVFGLFAAANLACIAPYYWPVATAIDQPSASLRLISVNVHTANQHFDLVRQLVLDYDPDVVLLMEVDADWVAALQELRARYPYWQVAVREDNFGIALCSKRPFAACRTLYLGAAELPSIAAEIEVEGQSLTLVGTHPLPPTSAAYTAARNEQLASVAQYVAAIPGLKIVMGDLNTTPWSHCFREFIASTKLVDSARGRGVQPSWPTSRLVLRIPIDFCLVSETMAVTDRHIGPDIGSDHFPVIVDVAVPAARLTANSAAAAELSTSLWPMRYAPSREG
jgi:endonuclease/exonuclease/phosphatase (EEP) superfamily protein YafD